MSPTLLLTTWLFEAPIGTRQPPLVLVSYSADVDKQKVDSCALFLDAGHGDHDGERGLI